MTDKKTTRRRNISWSKLADDTAEMLATASETSVTDLLEKLVYEEAREAIYREKRNFSKWLPR
jgi:RNA polymerase-interacting CarD/CdnL/TRCF family regulator